MNFGLYNTLKKYIEFKLYEGIETIEGVHEKIVVYYAKDKLTEGEFMSLYNLLYPKVEEVQEVQEGAMLLDEVVETVEMNVIPQSAINILQYMLDKKLIDNVDHKAQVLHNSGQLDDELYGYFQIEYSENPMQDTPTILPEIGDVPTILPEIEDVPTSLVEEAQPMVASLSLAEEVEAPKTKKAKSRKKKKTT